MKTFFTLLYITLVCCILLTPFVLCISGQEDPRPFFDNRQPAELPEFDIESLDPYPVAFESFFNDHFPYRNSTIHLLNRADLLHFNKSPVPNEVTVGTDGWLYPGKPDMEFLLGQDPLTDEMITAMIAELNDRYEQCKTIGVEYRLVVIPSKVTMYPEHLPLAYQFTQWNFPMDAFMERCVSECDVPVLYLKDSLMVHKKERDLFFRYDSHWTEAGSYFAYRAIMNWYMGQENESLFTVDLDHPVDELMYSGNYASLLGMTGRWQDAFQTMECPGDSVVHQLTGKNYLCDSSWFSYCDQYEITYQNSDSTLPSLLVVRDSYSHPRFQKLLAAHFSRSTFIWDYWQHKLNKEIVCKEKPDVVLCIMCENFLPNLLKFRNRSETGGANRLIALAALSYSMQKLKRQNSLPEYLLHHAAFAGIHRE